MKREIKVLMPCSNCLGEGKVFDSSAIGSGYEGDLHGVGMSKTCPSCNGGKILEIKSNHPEYSKYYRITLKKGIETAMDGIIASTKQYQKSIEDYDFYTGLLRKLGMEKK